MIHLLMRMENGIKSYPMILGIHYMMQQQVVLVKLKVRILRITCL